MKARSSRWGSRRGPARTAWLALALASGCWMKPVSLESVARRAAQAAELAAADATPTWRETTSTYSGSDQPLERRAGYVYPDGHFVRHGLQQGWYPDGQPRWERRYEQGAKHGSWRGWHETGTLAFEREFAHDVPSGTWRTWHPDGAPESEIELESADEGGCRARWWLPSGKLSSAGPVQDGVRTGVWELFREDGTLRARGSYVRGEREGTWTFFHSDGSLAERGDYHRNGRVGSWQRWLPRERRE